MKDKHVQPTYDDLKPIFEDVDMNGKDLLKDPKKWVSIREDIINRPNHYNLGTIETREYILDVLDNNKHLTAKDGYYLGNVLKYLSVRTGNKGDKLEDMKKAKNYLDKWIGEYE